MTNIALLNAQLVLEVCDRLVLKSYEVGDKEVSWFKDGCLIADAYYGHRSDEIVFADGTRFGLEDARNLLDYYASTRTEWN